LLFAVLAGHLEEVAAAVETACAQARLKPLAEMLSPPDKFAIEMMFAAMAGATRHVLESGASPVMIRNLRRHLVVLCQSYMTAQLANRLSR
jgi:hypothetical protein